MLITTVKKKEKMMQVCWQSLVSWGNCSRMQSCQLGRLCASMGPAYPPTVLLQGPFRNAHLTPQMQQFNKCMSEVRTSVEWLFNDIINYFKFLDLKKET